MDLVTLTRTSKVRSESVVVILHEVVQQHAGAVNQFHPALGGVVPALFASDPRHMATIALLLVTHHKNDDAAVEKIFHVNISIYF